MYSLSVRNSSGDSITLTGNEARYQVTDIQGLTPPAANVIVTGIAGMDGALLNSARLGTRQVVIYIRINGDVEENRIMLENVAGTKNSVRIYYTNRNRSVYIDGIVETFECGLFSQSEIAQIAVLCPQPYWLDVEQTLIQGIYTFGNVKFPLAINIGHPIYFSNVQGDGVADNDSDAETGLYFEYTLPANASYFIVVNSSTGDFLRVDYEFYADDIIKVNTMQGEKKLVLERDGNEIKLFSGLYEGSTFVQLRQGRNLIDFAVDGVYLNVGTDISIYFRKRYKGV